MLDGLETDYVTHRADCCVVRASRLRAVVDRVLDIVAALEGAGPGGGQEGGRESPTTPEGRSSPTETSSLLPSSQPATSTSSAADFGRNVGRLAKLSNLRCICHVALSIVKR